MDINDFFDAIVDRAVAATQVPFSDLLLAVHDAAQLAADAVDTNALGGQDLAQALHLLVPIIMGNPNAEAILRALTGR